MGAAASFVDIGIIIFINMDRGDFGAKMFENLDSGDAGGTIGAI